MDKLSSFKQFIKNNPTLVKYIKNGEMTWQKFYEIYDMYGEEQEVWKNYFFSEEEKNNREQTLDFITWLKKLDLDTIQEGVQNIQRVIGVIGDISTQKEEEKNYTPRPLYKHFDD